MTDEERIEAMRIRSALMVEPEKSALPPDPSLTPDAQWMRTYGVTTMEFLYQVMTGVREATRIQIEAAKELMAYSHQKQAAKVQAEVTTKTVSPELVEMFSLASREAMEKFGTQVRALEARH